eukprot:gb/GFBE01022658.1/.p1 GENE.gb/GFBE01022658.1/~~gb/GFBE01022658.1/.p1  ORF type:complete len:534 (+),score=119.21 gb/GFBE01022658.1/:1-1602(+)
MALHHWTPADFQGLHGVEEDAGLYQEELQSLLVWIDEASKDHRKMAKCYIPASTPTTPTADLSSASSSCGSHSALFYSRDWQANSPELDDPAIRATTACWWQCYSVAFSVVGSREFLDHLKVALNLVEVRNARALYRRMAMVIREQDHERLSLDVPASAQQVAHVYNDDLARCTAAGKSPETVQPPPELDEKQAKQVLDTFCKRGRQWSVQFRVGGRLTERCMSAETRRHLQVAATLHIRSQGSEPRFLAMCVEEEWDFKGMRRQIPAAPVASLKDLEQMMLDFSDVPGRGWSVKDEAHMGGILGAMPVQGRQCIAQLLSRQAQACPDLARDFAEALAAADAAPKRRRKTTDILGSVAQVAKTAIPCLARKLVLLSCKHPDVVRKVVAGVAVASAARRMAGRALAGVETPLVHESLGCASFDWDHVADKPASDALPSFVVVDSQMPPTTADMADIGRILEAVPDDRVAGSVYPKRRTNFRGVSSNIFSIGSPGRRTRYAMSSSCVAHQAAFGREADFRAAALAKEHQQVAHGT